MIIVAIAETQIHKPVHISSSCWYHIHGMRPIQDERDKKYRLYIGFLILHLPFEDRITYKEEKTAPLDTEM
jgi:hypothetical protein